MGNDGGSIPKRRELVKSAARARTTTELKESHLESLTHAWTFCPITGAPLDPASTVSDHLGRLYSYESILQCLLPSPDTGEAAAEAQEEAFRATGIRSLRDVLKLKFCTRKDDKGREFRACFVSQKELGAATKAAYLVPCGHVFAEVALKEIQSAASSAGEEEAESRCPECSEAFESSNVIPILGASDPEVAKRLEARIEDLKAKGLTHTLKKDKNGVNGKKKRKAGDADATNGDGETGSGKKEKKKVKESGIESRINNAMTASLTAKVLAEQEENNKRRKMIEGYKKSEAVR
ncbi:Rtf2 RING-finger-domain-containing protein [Xylariales sp. PMI_506]|nr:Rtf2 RING-finger-domain-containing protein [Xylariales sp. PMI_506]